MSCLHPAAAMAVLRAGPGHAAHRDRLAGLPVVRGAAARWGIPGLEVDPVSSPPKSRFLSVDDHVRSGKPHPALPARRRRCTGHPDRSLGGGPASGAARLSIRCTHFGKCVALHLQHHLNEGGQEHLQYGQGQHRSQGREVQSGDQGKPSPDGLNSGSVASHKKRMTGWL